MSSAVQIGIINSGGTEGAIVSLLPRSVKGDQQREVLAVVCWTGGGITVEQLSALRWTGSIGDMKGAK